MAGSPCRRTSWAAGIVVPEVQADNSIRVRCGGSVDLAAAEAAPWDAVDSDGPGNPITSTLETGESHAYRLIDSPTTAPWPVQRFTVNVTGALMSVYRRQPGSDYWQPMRLQVETYDGEQVGNETWFIILRGTGAYTLTHN